MHGVQASHSEEPPQHLSPVHMESEMQINRGDTMHRNVHYRVCDRPCLMTPSRVESKSGTRSNVSRQTSPRCSGASTVFNVYFSVVNLWLSSHIWLFRLVISQLSEARCLVQPRPVFSTAACAQSIVESGTSTSPLSHFCDTVLSTFPNPTSRASIVLPSPSCSHPALRVVTASHAPLLMQTLAPQQHPSSASLHCTESMEDNK
ncbi:hypothetical protein EYF80_020412 [Liparis tanakae]|uniref:Uncharacterized protein n=1 Tax=Liparis tanakae TaxID=230148 RepID=A0A4Z2HV14_9TELE|nr:hypothetical protein EYF80_020412 [Liparis tanakae]